MAVAIISDGHVPFWGRLREQTGSGVVRQRLIKEEEPRSDCRDDNEAARYVVIRPLRNAG